jgi:hypothetical protein
MNGENDLAAINEQSVEVEQHGGKDARKFFDELLSDELMFRRASGKILGKTEFLQDLEKNSPFSSRTSGIISVTAIDDRALVNLVVVGTRADDGSVHRYRNIRLFSRSDGKWRMEFWYNYEIAG